MGIQHVLPSVDLHGCHEKNVILVLRESDTFSLSSTIDVSRRAQSDNTEPICWSSSPGLSTRPLGLEALWRRHAHVAFIWVLLVRYEVSTAAVWQYFLLSLSLGSAESRPCPGARLSCP
ncbi:unnamed protein product [Boreogadus saida]